MCNGNELHCQSNGNGNDYISKKCVMVMVMVMKKLQCNGNGKITFKSNWPHLWLPWGYNRENLVSTLRSSFLWDRLDTCR